MESKQIQPNQPLLTATIIGAKTKVLSLLRNGADVNSDRNSKGWTCLMCAVIGGNAEIVASVLAAKADIDIRDKKGNTALMHAANHGKTEIVSMLLAAEADISTLDIQTTQNIFTIVLLIDAGLPFTAKTEFNTDGSGKEEMEAFTCYVQSFLATEIPRVRFGEGYHNRSIREAINFGSIQTSKDMDTLNESIIRPMIGRFSKRV